MHIVMLVFKPPPPDLVIKILEAFCPHSQVGPFSIVIETAEAQWVTHPSALGPEDLRNVRKPTLRTGAGPEPRVQWEERSVQLS